MYEYQTVSIPKYLSSKYGINMGQAVANYVEEVINNFTEEGWEYYRSDSFTVQEQVGCLLSLFGVEGKMGVYNVLVFRRKIEYEEDID